MFIKDEHGGYINSDHITGAYAEEVSGQWRIKTSMIDVTGSVTLAGAWTTEAKAQETIRELFRGIDPSTFGDC